MEKHSPEMKVARGVVALLATLAIIGGGIAFYALANATAGVRTVELGQPAPAVVRVVTSAGRVSPTHMSRARRTRAVRLDGLPAFGRLNPKSLGFQWPVTGWIEITSPFGPRDGGFHHGTDIGCAIGQPLYASRAGRVIFVGDAEPGYGLTVMIDHGSGYQTLYAHMSKLEVQLGQIVRTREEIGRCGMTGNATGPHVHFEMRYAGFVWDPVRFLP